MLCVIALAVAACGGDGGETPGEDSTTTTTSATTTSTRPPSHGIDAGLWEVDGDLLIVSDVESASTVTAQAVVDGELVDLPGAWSLRWRATPSGIARRSSVRATAWW